MERLYRLMSGRFSFTAGNTLTAAQLNTNIMAGLPYNYQVGTTSVTLTSSATWSYGSTNVTGLTGFTVDPYVVGNVETTATTSANVCHFDATGPTTMTVYALRSGASTATLAVRWIAIQATSSTAAGS
jgi:hypothetical protein